MRERSWARLLVSLAVAAAARPTFAAGEAPVSGIRWAPSVEGRLGAWLVVGPFREAEAKKGTKARPPQLAFVPPGLDEARLAPALGAPVGVDERPFVVAASDGSSGVDLRSALGLGNGAREAEYLAYAGILLEAGTAQRGFLLIQGAEALQVVVNGRVHYAREAPLASGDEDQVPLRLSRGAHRVVLKVRSQGGGLLTLRTRLVDETFRAPAGVVAVLPGAQSAEAQRLAQRAAQVSVDRGLTASGYEPKVLVRFPDGSPVDVVGSMVARVVTRERELASTGPVPLLAKAAARGEWELSLPALEGPLAEAVEDQLASVEVDVLGRSWRFPFPARRVTRAATRRALFALAATPSDAPWLRRGSFASVEHLRRRLVDLVGRGDDDKDAQLREASDLESVAARLEANRDPFEGRTGFLRRAYRSPVDGELSPYALYVPPGYREGTKRSYPLIVALHGLNGKPMAMLRWFFGGDDPKRDQEWEDRHTDGLAPLDAFVVAPAAHGNTMYRHLGQDDVLRVIDEVTELYPAIDRGRVSVTGPSMGGIGAAALALRMPDRFAAAAPLCGYHSVFVRRDVLGKALRPWERFLAEERSNASWAENGARTPMFIVHGTEDLPVENSGVLVERYEALKFPVVFEAPKLGHNVWQTTYEELKAAKWLMAHARDQHPRTVRFRTARTRDGRAAWVTVSELERPDSWAEVDARVVSRRSIAATTRGVGALELERDARLLDPAAPTSVTVDGQTFHVASDAPLAFHKNAGRWSAGVRPASATPRKQGTLTGPFRDVFHEPLLFVYGASDPLVARVNEDVARAFARVRGGVDVQYPILSDVEFVARGEPVGHSRPLFLVGTARSNLVLRALASELPIQVDERGISVGGRLVTNGERDAGTAFVFPNPKRPDRYVAVVSGMTALATYRALSLPDLLPDFVVYDERLKSARGQMILGSASVIAGGFFTRDWAAPSGLVDPFAKSSASPAKAGPSPSDGEM